jgi:hypothetical protein
VTAIREPTWTALEPSWTCSLVSHELDQQHLSTYKNLCQYAVILRFYVHLRLIGFDFEKHVTGRERVSFLDLPARNVALGHGR